MDYFIMKIMKLRKTHQLFEHLPVLNFTPPYDCRKIPFTQCQDNTCNIINFGVHTRLRIIPYTRRGKFFIVGQRIIFRVKKIFKIIEHNPDNRRAHSR